MFQLGSSSHSPAAGQWSRHSGLLPLHIDIPECEARCKLPIHQIQAILSSSVCLTTIHWFLMFHQTSQLTASVPLLVSSIQFAHIPLQNYKVCNPSGAGLQGADYNHRECLPANGAQQAQCCSVLDVRPDTRDSETRQDSRTAFRDSIF